MTVIEILRNEHALILQMLALLEHHLRKVSAGGALDREFARWVVDFSREFADDTHHAKEEGVLFGWLESRGLSRASGPLGTMLADHRHCRSQAEDMAAALARADFSAFTVLASDLAQSLRRHMASEGENLFPMAEKLMTPAEDAEAVQAFGRVVREREGALVRSRHLAAIERWRRSFGLPPF